MNYTSIIIKRLIFTLLLVCLISFSFAKEKGMMINKAEIINTELISIIQTRIIPNIPNKPQKCSNIGIDIVCNKQIDKKYSISIQILLTNELDKNSWKSIEGICFINNTMVTFSKCKQAGLIRIDKRDKPYHVIPYEAIPIRTDYPEWKYEFCNGKFTLIEEILAW